MSMRKDQIMIESKPWHGLMKILEIQHWKNNEIIWEAKNLNNLLHFEGEEFLLRAAFTGGRDSSIIPDNYYLGLDSRATPIVGDTITSLITEPVENGYVRQPLSSSGDLVVADVSGHFRATSKIVAFRAQGGEWGPVSTLFLTDKETDDGSLICSVPLGVALTVADGESMTLRLAFALRDCPPT